MSTGANFVIEDTSEIPRHRVVNVSILVQNVYGPVFVINGLHDALVPLTTFPFVVRPETTHRHVNLEQAVVLVLSNLIRLLFVESGLFVGLWWWGGM